MIGIRMTWALWFSLVACFSPTFASAQEGKEKDRQARIEMHEQMARQHQKAAKCLKAGKPVKECHQEAMKGCPMMKSGKCPFMEDMGMSRGGMMQQEE